MNNKRYKHQINGKFLGQYKEFDLYFNDFENRLYAISSNDPQEFISNSWSETSKKIKNKESITEPIYQAYRLVLQEKIKHHCWSK